MGLDLRGRDADRLPAVRRLLPRRPLPPRPPPATSVACASPSTRGPTRSPAATTRRAVDGFFEALVPAVPYAPSTAFLGAEKAKLSRREEERRRVALIADGIGSMHGVTHTIEQIRERGVPGFEVDVIGTDAGVDRRLPAAAELELPFYAGMTLGVPGLPDLVETLAEGGYDLIHVTAPGPAGHRRDPAQPGHRDAAARQLPHRAGHLRRAAQRRRRPRGDRDGGARRLLRRPPPGPLAEPRGRQLAGRSRHRRGPDRPLGARRRHRPLRPGEGRPGRLPRRDESPLRRPHDPREGGRPAGRQLPARRAARTRACTCCWPAAAPRRGSCGRGSASTRPSSAGSAARSWPPPTPAPTSSSSAAAPTPTAR